MSDLFNPDHDRRERELRRKERAETGQGTGVALIVLGLMLIGLLFFAVMDDDGVPARLTDSAAVSN